MKNILIIADGIVAKHYLETIFKQKNIVHNFTIISCKSDFSGLDTGGFACEFLKFDPTSLMKLRVVASEKFDRFIIVLDEKNDAITTYKNLKKINPEEEIYFIDAWKIGKNNEIFKGDFHLKLIDIFDIVTSRLMGILPDFPILADNIGMGKGEIMEVKVPVMSAFSYKKILLFRNEKFNIPMIYRHNRYIVTNDQTTIFPNDTLLIVGEPTALRSVYGAIKRESGQFPLPFGMNIYFFVDVLRLDLAKFELFLQNLAFLQTKFANAKIFIRVINPVPSKFFTQIKALENEILISYENKFDYLQNDIKSKNIGLIVANSEIFARAKRTFFELKIPVLTLGNFLLEAINRAVILSGGADLKQECSVMFDLCSQLNLDIYLHFFNPILKNAPQILSQYKVLAELFKREFKVIQNENNPLNFLNARADLLHFIPFNESVLRSGMLSNFSKNLDELYFKLSANHQFFIPNFYEI